MGNSGLKLKLFLLLFLIVYVALVSLASHKLIKSKLTAGDKVYWTVAFVVFNLLAAIPFILYHDYLLAPEKRSE
jgi:hypothetical protein